MNEAIKFFALCCTFAVLVGCRTSKRAEPPKPTVPPVLRNIQKRADIVEKVETVSLNMSATAAAGPAGVMQSDLGFTWIIPSTNRYVFIETKDRLHNSVIRYLHDREVYGNSLVIWPGPIDAVNHPELPDTLNPAAYFRTRYTTNHP